LSKLYRKSKGRCGCPLAAFELPVHLWKDEAYTFMKKIFLQISSSLLAVSLASFCSALAVDDVHPYAAASYWTEQYVHASGAKSLALVFHTDAGVRYRIELTHDLVNWESVETHYGLGQDIAISMLQTAAAPPSATPPPTNLPVVIHPKIASLMMRPATTSGLVLQWQSLDNGSLQQHHFPNLTIGAAWLQNCYYCQVFDQFYFCLSHPILPAVAVPNNAHGTIDTSMLNTFENNYPTMVAGVELSLAQQRLNPYVPAPVDPNSKKFFRIVSDWSLDSDGDFTPDWVEWLAMQGKQGLQAVTTVANPGGTFQVSADPFSAAKNPDGSGTAVSLDSDGDGIVDIEDADLTSKQINWKNISPVRYALFPLPSPAIPAQSGIGNEPTQINAQGTVLYPRNVWKNGQLSDISFTQSDLEDLAKATSLNDVGNIFGEGHIGSTLAFYTLANSLTPLEVKGTVSGVTIGGFGPANLTLPGITNTGSFITQGIQQSTLPITDPIMGKFLWHIDNNQLSYTKIADNLEMYADPGIFWRYENQKTVVSKGGGTEVELAGRLEKVCETPATDTLLFLGGGHAYSQKLGEPWTAMVSTLESLNYIREFSRAGVGYKTPNSLWMNSKVYLLNHVAPEYDKHPIITDLSNSGHLLLTLYNEQTKSFLAGFPFQLEDNEFATGVDNVSCSVANGDKGYQDKLWIMAPQGPLSVVASPSPNNSNSLTIKSVLDASTLNCTCANSQFNGSAAQLVMTGNSTLLTISGKGTTTTDDKFTFTMGTTAAVSFPIGVKSMKRRTVKVIVYPVKRLSTSENTTVPTAETLEAELNQVFGKQINAYFSVTIKPQITYDYDNLPAATGQPSTNDSAVTDVLELQSIYDNCPSENNDIMVAIISDGKIAIGNEGNVGLTIVGSRSSVVVAENNSFITRTESQVLRSISHEIGHIMIDTPEESGHPNEDAGGCAPLRGSDTAKRLMCGGFQRSPDGALLVKKEWDNAEKWLKKVPDERKRISLQLSTIDEVGNY
jgi:Metallo-peptidase family M12B Reprolysin-like